jgi:hypothetical protein
MKALSRWRAERRQRSHYPQFRIAEPRWAADQQVRLRQLADQLDAAAATAAAATRRGPAPNEKDIALTATSLWRARRRLARLAEESPAEAKRVGRLLMTTEEGLQKNLGVQIQDHDGEDYHEGRAMEVRAFQEDPALDRAIVRETLLPTIYLADRHIQLAQVIVGCPPRSGTTSTMED